MKKLGLPFSWKHKHKGDLYETSSEVFAYILPPLVRNALDYLIARNAVNVEGIFRVTGSISDIERIAKKYDKGKEIPLHNITNPHTVAGLLKHYIRHKTLVPPWMRSCFLAAGDIQDEQLRILCVSKALKLLPPSNLYVLTKICEYLYEVQRYEHENKMSAYNLSLIFGNTFLPASGENIEAAFAQSSHAYAFTETLIRHYHTIFHTNQDISREMVGENMPLTAKVFLELFESSSPPISQQKTRHATEGCLPSKEKVVGEPQLLSLQHRNASVGFQRTKKNTLPLNKHLEEALLLRMCERDDVELLAEYLRLGEPELFASYLARIAPDDCSKDKIRKAAIKMYRDKRKGSA